MAPAQTNACLKWFSSLEQIVNEAGVTDAEARPLQGFPYLRVNRHLQAVGNQIATPRQRQDWLLHLRNLDQKSRLTELSNLPAGAVEALQAQIPTLELPQSNTGINSPMPFGELIQNGATRLGTERLALLNAANSCGNLLLEQDQADAVRQRHIRQAAVVPDHYSSARRAAGAYKLSSLGVAAGVREWEQQTQATFEQTPQLGMSVNLKTGQARAGQAAVTRLLASRRSDTLGVPVLTAQVRRLLLQEFTPEFVIEQTGLFDEPGKLVVNNAGQVEIDPLQPTIYARLEFTRYGNRSLIQLVYTVWFSERPTQSAMDIYAGQLDGVIVRLTLNATGVPAVIDTIHPCGCYHLFFNTPAAQRLDRPEHIGKRDEWRFMPGQALDSSGPGRLQVHVQGATHYVSHVSFRPARPASTNTAEQTRVAELLPERSLTRLPIGSTNTSRSLYQANGLIAGTERSERWILWPMGIDSAGAMRQWGTHATAFVGRRHFDDADLIESRFDIR